MTRFTFPTAPRRILSLLAILGVFLGFSPVADAIELHLRNGDRITGQLVGREDGKIIFRSRFLGEIRVSEGEAVLVDTPETPVESLAGIPPAASLLPKPTTVGASGEMKPKITPWRGKVEFGFQQQSGRTDTLQASLRADAEKISGPDSYRFEARLLYSEQYLQTTSDRYDGTFRYRHELSPRVFSQSLTSYTKDRVKNIDHNAEQNFGFGYRLIQRPRHQASVGGGLTLQYRSAQGVESGYTYLGEIFQDYTYKLTGRLSLIQDANVSYSPEPRGRLAYTNTQGYIATDDSAANYRVRFNSALQGKVTESISLNLRFEYEFDNAILNPRAKVDQRITSSIGYGF